MRLLTSPVEAHDVLSPDSTLPKINRFQTVEVESLLPADIKADWANDEKIPLTGDDTNCAFRWWGINE